MDKRPLVRQGSSEPLQSVLPLRLERLSYQVGDKSLIDDLSLQIEAGLRYLILGANGAGKSLLLRLMHGLITPTGGRMTWGMEQSLALHARGRQAMVFQRPVMLRRTARDNVAFALKVAGLRGNLQAQADQALDRVGLLALANRPARLCSVGEQQRLALARAWAVRPEILFLDEPSASLDPGATYQLEGIVNAMHKEGATIVMASHDLAQARRLADHVFFLHQGKLLESAPASLFFDKPQSPVANAFLKGELVWEELR
jgi:tungstate transport system ATP-binding protein